MDSDVDVDSNVGDTEDDISLDQYALQRYVDSNVDTEDNLILVTLSR